MAEGWDQGGSGDPLTDIREFVESQRQLGMHPTAITDMQALLILQTAARIGATLPADAETFLSTFVQRRQAQSVGFHEAHRLLRQIRMNRLRLPDEYLSVDLASKVTAHRTPRNRAERRAEKRRKR